MILIARSIITVFSRGSTYLYAYKLCAQFSRLGGGYFTRIMAGMNYTRFCVFVDVFIGDLVRYDLSNIKFAYTARLNYMGLEMILSLYSFYY